MSCYRITFADAGAYDIEIAQQAETFYAKVYRLIAGQRGPEPVSQGGRTLEIRARYEHSALSQAYNWLLELTRSRLQSIIYCPPISDPRD